MKVLAVETSCDETSSSVVERKENRIKVLSNTISSSIKLHTQTGGIIPENAAREQLKFMLPVIMDSLIKSENIKRPISKKEKFFLANKILKEKVDAIAVTIGPGLIGSLLVGVETAKTLSFAFNKPIIPVNHLLGHIYANFIENNWEFKIGNLKLGIDFPFIGLIVSGGHTDLLLFKSHKNFKWLGGTRDDAAGEAFDKIARILDLSYPGGPEIERRAKLGEKGQFNFKSPMIDTEDFDFSFSGLKTEALREVKKISKSEEQTVNNISFAVQEAIVKVLVKKTIKAAKKFKISTIVLGGGVSANQALRERINLDAKRYLLDANVFFPELKYTTDNAAMIGVYALLSGKPTNWRLIKAEPELYFN